MSLRVLLAAGAAALLGAAACARDGEESEPTADPADEPEAVSEPRDPEYLPLLTKGSGKGNRVHSRIYVPATYDGQGVLLSLDTGWPRGAYDLTFVGNLTAPQKINVAGVSRALEARARIEQTSAAFGIRIAGCLGADYLLEHPSVVHTNRRLLVRYPPGSDAPDIDGWHALPTEIVQGHIVVKASLNQDPVRLIVDTRVPAVVWMGKERGAGDRTAVAKDIDIRPLRGSFGKARLHAGSYSARVPVFRVKSFPMLQQTRQRLGGEIHGLMGLSAFGDRAFAVRDETLYIEPE